MGLTVLSTTDRLLRVICGEVEKKELRTPEVQQTIDDLLDFVYGNNDKRRNKKRTKSITVGLSANQVGIMKRISIVDLAIGKRNFNDIHVLINPEIIWKSITMIEHCEGCVNLPNIWGYVQRSKKIKVTALDRSGNKLLLTLTGWPATLLQHEIDHLNGKLFIDYIEDPTKALLVEKDDYVTFKKEKKNWKKYVDVTNLRI